MRQFLILTLLLSVFVAPVFAGQVTPHLAAVLADAQNGNAVSVIVTMAERPEPKKFHLQPEKLRVMTASAKTRHRTDLVQALQQQADRTQVNLRSFLRQQGLSFQTLWIDNSLVVTASADVITQLASFPEVLQVRQNLVITRSGVVPAATEGVEDNLIRINADDLWAMGITGSGSVVASLDTGVDGSHSNLGPKFVPGGWYNPIAPLCDDIFLDLICNACGRNELTPCDVDGHGTGVTGIMVGGSIGEPLANETEVGVAPDATWMAAKIFDDNPVSSLQKAPVSAIHAAYQWALDPGGGMPAPDVVNNSWALSATNLFIDEFRADIQALKAAGIIVVFAAGNIGPGSSTSVSPANYPEALAVGSVDSSDTVSTFSARGPSAYDGVSIYPDLVAPGENIKTADLTFNIWFNNEQFVDGTSFSAPHVAGVLALLHQAYPAAPMDDLEQALIMSAEDLGVQGPDNEYGNGLVDALAAYNYLSGVPVISIHDPVAPENDLDLPFGHITPGTSSDQTLTVSNTGGGLLVLGTLDQTALLPPFSIQSDSCSGQGLFTAESCAVTIRFSPPDFFIYTGELTIPSNDPVDASVTVTVSGVGNTPPPAANLLSPANDAVDISRPVTFSWAQVADADGDTILNTLLFSESPDFIPFSSIDVVTAVADSSAVLFAGCGLFATALLFRRRHYRSLRLVLIVLSAFVVLSCGSGGSGGGIAGDIISYEHNGLLSGTTYYWKVQSTDTSNGVAESVVYRFTTAP